MMKNKSDWKIKVATDKDDHIIAQHFYQLWLDNDIPAEQLQDNLQEITVDFLNQARQDSSFKAWLVEIEGEVVASISCQLFKGLYPLVFKSDVRQYGYIWNVYVESNYRRQGIATALMNEATNYLKSIGCTRIVLHASPSGKPVYENLGFIPNNEMRLDLL